MSPGALVPLDVHLCFILHDLPVVRAYSRTCVFLLEEGWKDLVSFPFCATGSCRSSMFASFTLVFIHQIDAKLLKLLADLDKECPPPHTTARLLDTLVRLVNQSSTKQKQVYVPCGC